MVYKYCITQICYENKLLEKLFWLHIKIQTFVRNEIANFTYNTLCIFVKQFVLQKYNVKRRKYCLFLETRLRYIERNVKSREFYNV